jgi:hypothetical protein
MDLIESDLKSSQSDNFELVAILIVKRDSDGSRLLFKYPYINSYDKPRKSSHFNQSNSWRLNAVIRNIVFIFSKNSNFKQTKEVHFRLVQTITIGLSKSKLF